MAELPKIYNSRILKLYTQCISENYPEVNIDGVLRAAGISRYEMEDQGHWFNQVEIDAFFSAVVQETGNSGIAREAGRHVVANETSGPVKQAALGLLQISSIYLLLPKLYPNFSRGAAVKTRKLASNKVEICITPLPDVQESPHQCENRIGIFESLCLPFTGQYATIEHEECLHRQGGCCRYVASWSESKQIKWKRLSTVAMIGGAGVSLGSLLFWPLTISLPVMLASMLAVAGTSLRASQVYNQELATLIQNQGSVAEDHIREIDYRYRGALLVQTIGRASATILDKRRLAEIVVQNIKHYLDFDRGMIMLANKNRSRLVYSAGYGFDQPILDLLEKTRFRLDNSESKGLFVQVFRDQRPVLVEDIDAMSDVFSPRSRELIHQIESKSMICLPIVHEDQSMGIMAVDNIITKRPLTKSDMNLLMAVAYQTAVSIFSAAAFKELQGSEERYRSLYENAPTAYVSISIEDALIVNCNAAAERLLGYHRSHLIGSALLGYVAKDEPSRLRARRIHERLTLGKPVRNEALALLHRNGDTAWVMVSLEPFKDSGGHLVEGRCILVDTTEQRRLEEQLRKAQQMEAIGTLAGGVAHDLSNIMAAIVGYPDLLLMDVEPDSTMYQPLVKLRSAGKRAAAIVQDLLTLSRRGVAITDVVNLNDIFKEYLGSPEYDNLISHHPHVEVLVDLAPDLLPIKGSTVHLIKTIMNVTHNAAESLSGGGVIRVRTRNQYVTAQDFPEKGVPGQFVVLSVQDNGFGIAAADLKRVFEPFFTKKAMGRSGTGLGMAIVWGAVQDHNGFIDIRSKLGKGTTVELYFPATAEKPAQHPVEKDTARKMGRGEKILVADDRTEHREIAVHMLARLGYDVTAVDSAEAVIALVKDGYRPDGVIMDADVELDHDTSLGQKILDIYPELGVLVIAGVAKPDRLKQVLDTGIATFIHKPYDLNELGTTLRYELDSRPPEKHAAGHGDR
jgi:PAS domain S-box-containing protein